ASVILLRGGRETLKVLLVRRTPEARFMGGVWVFPGGAVDGAEGDGDGAHRAAAIRELREEAAIALDGPDALVKFSRWITPAQVRRAARRAARGARGRGRPHPAAGRAGLLRIGKPRTGGPRAHRLSRHGRRVEINSVVGASRKGEGPGSPGPSR